MVAVKTLPALSARPVFPTAGLNLRKEGLLESTPASLTPYERFALAACLARGIRRIGLLAYYTSMVPVEDVRTLSGSGP